MLTTFIVNGLIWWAPAHRYQSDTLWFAWGDHGPYSPIEFGGI